MPRPGNVFVGNFFAKYIFYICMTKLYKNLSMFFGFTPLEMSPVLEGVLFGQNVRIEVQHLISDILHYNEIPLLLWDALVRLTDFIPLSNFFKCFYSQFFLTFWGEKNIIYNI